MRLSLLVLLLCSTWASAHRIDVTVAINATSPERLQLLACYDDGTPAARAEAQLFDATGQLLSSVRLDDAGSGTLLDVESRGASVVVSDGTGHRVKVQLDDNKPSSMSIRDNRWVMIALGLGGVATATFLAKRLNRMRQSPAT